MEKATDRPPTPTSDAAAAAMTDTPRSRVEKVGNWKLDIEKHRLKNDPTKVFSITDWNKILELYHNMSQEDSEKVLEGQFKGFFKSYELYAEPALKADDWMDMEEILEDMERRFYRIRALMENIEASTEDMEQYKEVRENIYTIREHQARIDQMNEDACREEEEDDDDESPGVQSKLRGTLYSKMLDKKAKQN